MTEGFKGERFTPKKYPKGRAKRGLTFQVAHIDDEEIEYLMDALGVGQGEAIRTAIRVYGQLLRQQQRR